MVKLTQIGNRFCIVTNQSGVKRGLIQQESLDEIHSYIKIIFLEHNIPLVGIYVCIDLPNSASERRKPETGMFLEASNAHNIDLKKSLMMEEIISDAAMTKKVQAIIESLEEFKNEEPKKEMIQKVIKVQGLIHEIKSDGVN